MIAFKYICNLLIQFNFICKKASILQHSFTKAKLAGKNAIDLYFRKWKLYIGLSAKKKCFPNRVFSHLNNFTRVPFSITVKDI